MAPTKMELLISQLVDLIRMRYQRLNLCFGVQQSIGTTENNFHRTGNGKCKMATIKLEVPISQFVDTIGTRFRRPTIGVLRNCLGT